MTEFCFPNQVNNNNNDESLSKSSIFTNICSFMLSYLLYISYLIFFSPYLFKLISYIFPLFFTTFLLILSLVLTLIPLKSIINLEDGLFLTLYAAFLKSFEEEKLLAIEGFEVYKFVFDETTIELNNEANSFEENNVCEKEEMRVDEKRVIISEEKKEGEVSGPEVKSTSKFTSSRVDCGKNTNLLTFEPIRKEKEWRRTLACFLFEEKHNWSNKRIALNRSCDDNGNSGGNGEEEGMDLLWETEEIEVINKENLKQEVNEKKLRKKRSKIIEDLIIKKDNCNDDDQSDEFDDNGKICCLQALKLSAGKMNLSMGSSKLAKFSKAFKGIGWLHGHAKKHEKKGTSKICSI